jgi:hypothetical protein
MLDKYPPSGEILDLIEKFQLPRECMSKIIAIVSGNAKELDEQELLPFIKKFIFMASDNVNIISKFMEHPSSKITEFLMARWTFPALPDENVLKRIFSDIQNEKLIISTLNMLKKRDVNMYPGWLAQKIAELQTHGNASVRLWAKAVLSNKMW